MASGKTVNTEKLVCPFYLSSSCKNGDKCKYSHDALRTDRNNSACVFFLKGICKYGDSCWFLHSTDNKNVNSTLSSHKEKNMNGNSTSKREDNTRKLPLASREKQLLAKNSDLKNSNFINPVKNSSFAPDSPNWVNAPEFVPRSHKSYSDVVKSNDCVVDSEPQKLDMENCMHYYEGWCPYEECPCVHGDLCDLCQKYCLNPFDEQQRNHHIELCEKEFEQDMEFSFSVQRSMDKTCGICMDIVMEKDTIAERVFGILENCNHVFCLSCIRNWRSIRTFEVAQHVEQSFDPVVTRSCPECRVSSHFITPSRYWIDSEDEKKKVIADYKLALSKKPCKYFKQGDGVCPFGGACFYLHAKKDGTKVVLPTPTRRRRQNQDGELDYVDNIILWDFLENRDDYID